MRYRLYLMTVLLYGCSLFLIVPGSADSDMKITGRLVRVDAAGGIIYVMHDSRIVQFRASKEICHRFRDNINSFVEIGFSKCSEKGFCVVTMEIIPEESFKAAESTDVRYAK